MPRKPKPHQLRLEPNPPLRPRPVTIARWGRDQWRIGGWKVRQRRAQPDGGMAWSTQPGEPAAWISFSAEERERLERLPERVIKQQPPPAPIIDPARFTIHLTLRDTGAALSVQRLTDSLFIATLQPDQPQIVLGFVPLPAGGALALTAAGSLALTADDHRRLLAMPAWKLSMTYARHRDSYGQLMREQAFKLALEQVVPVLVDGRPGDLALAARILRQVRIPPNACPVEWLARVPLPLPAFLSATEPPAILDPPAGGPDPPGTAPPGLSLAEAIAGFAAAVRRQREQARQAEHRSQEALRLASERQAALERQRDAALRQMIAPEQIEATLAALAYLNRWAKAADQLRRQDRQTLYALKELILRAAWAAGQARATGYLAGPFAPFAGLDPLALGDSIAEALADEFGEPPPAALALARRLQPPGQPAIDTERLGAAICARLAELAEAAQASRRPVDPAALAALGLMPGDFPACRGGWGWDGLDQRGLGFLDPEDFSLISFGYASPAASFDFHLPFRIAEAWLPAAELASLRAQPAASREADERFGRPMTPEEALLHPPDALLRQLGLPVELYFPLGVREQAPPRASPPRWEAWRDYEDEEEELEF